MIPKQIALSRLARRALSAAHDLPPAEHAEVCTLVATALHDDCPDLAQAAARAAATFNEAKEAEADLLNLLDA